MLGATPSRIEQGTKISDISLIFATNQRTGNKSNGCGHAIRKVQGTWPRGPAVISEIASCWAFSTAVKVMVHQLKEFFMDIQHLGQKRG